MAQIYLLVAGVMLCSATTCSLGQNLSGIPSQVKGKMSTYLRLMKKIPSMTQATRYHHLILQQIGNLLNIEESRAAWNNTLFDQLLSQLHHSLEQLWKQMEEDNLACPYLEIVVQKYFQRIYSYPKEKGYSLCGWEIVRVKIEVCLSRRRHPHGSSCGLLSLGCH
uniref:Uncharacterized protein n=2 Tax=Sus scrofa TaxID=9823 RepID=A0A8D0JBK9_PIG